MIRVLLVDDQPLLRGGFRALLDLEEDIEVVAEASDGQEGLDMVRRHRPDIALIDVQMPVVDGIAATRLIAADPDLAEVAASSMSTTVTTANENSPKQGLILCFPSILAATSPPTPLSPAWPSSSMGALKA